MSREEQLQYWRDYSKRRRLDPEYRERAAEKQREYRKNNRDKVREASRKSEARRRLRRYNLTLEDYQELFKTQGSKCGICGTLQPTTKNWHLDHCHTTLKVRGILCHHCNLLLGNSRDSVEILEAAIRYLKNVT